MSLSMSPATHAPWKVALVVVVSAAAGALFAYHFVLPLIDRAMGVDEIGARL